MAYLAIAALLFAAGILLVVKRGWRMWIIERTTIRSANQLRGSYLKNIDATIAVAHWLIPGLTFIMAAIFLHAGLGAR